MKEKEQRTCYMNEERRILEGVSGQREQRDEDRWPSKAKHVQGHKEMYSVSANLETKWRLSGHNALLSQAI